MTKKIISLILTSRSFSRIRFLQNSYHFYRITKVKFENRFLALKISKTNCRLNFGLFSLIDVALLRNHDFFHDFLPSSFCSVELNMVFPKCHNCPGFFDFPLQLWSGNINSIIVFYSGPRSVSFRIFCGFLDNFTKSSILRKTFSLKLLTFTEHCWKWNCNFLLDCFCGRILSSCAVRFFSEFWQCSKNDI